MKIVLLSAASSIHTVRWANGLSNVGHKVHLISHHLLEHKINDTVTFHMLPYRGLKGYYLNVVSLKRLLKKIQPDILNVHYASGYGTTARLSDFHPYILSVWGSDVYDFPSKSQLHKRLIKKNLMAADRVVSTSHCMAEHTKSLMAKGAYISVTPFGVDIEKFINKKIKDKDHIIIGTVKSLAPIYGIDILIKSFAQLKKEINDSHLDFNIQLKIIGDGPQMSELKTLAGSLDVTEYVDFIGSVPHNQVPSYLSEMDIFVALSRFESFGVAVIEAAAAALPVVVSNVGGLSEVTIDGVTGFVVEKEDPHAAASALLKLIKNQTLRLTMGNAGRVHVNKHYEWSVCIQKMLKVYEDVIQETHSKSL